MPESVLLLSKLGLTAWACFITQPQNLVWDVKIEREPLKKLWEVRVPHVRSGLAVLCKRGTF